MHSIVTTEETQKRELKKCIYILSSSMTGKEEISDLIEPLKNIYVNGFRHAYSEFFPIIVDIYTSKEDYSLEYLSNNLVELKNIVSNSCQNNTKEDKRFRLVINKLCDHLNLEIARYNYYLIKEQQVNDVDNRLKEIKKETEEIIKKNKKANKKLKSVQTDLITVLSIFSAIILTFSFGVSSFGNILSNIKDAPFLKSSYFILLCGFVMINLLFAMMYFISKITERSIYARCKTENCTCNPRCNGLTRIKKRLPYIYYLNGIILILMAIFLFMNITILPNIQNYVSKIIFKTSRRVEQNEKSNCKKYKFTIIKFSNATLVILINFSNIKHFA